MIWNFLIILALAGPPATTRSSTDLRDRCDALLQDVVKRPYGWAWAAETSGDSKPGKRRDTIVAMDRCESAAAGLVLLWAGRTLGERSYVEASREIARGVAAAQQPSGMIMSRPTFAAGAGGRETPQYVPSRSATVAGLALLLAQFDEPSSNVEVEPPLTDAELARFRSSAIRAATWLAKQQGRNGAWPIGFPPDAPASEAQRLQRLDDPVAFRDSTFALLLAGEITAVRNLRDSADRSVALLLNLRLARPPSSANLWATAYTMEGLLTSQRANFPDGADLIATRHAIQTLLATHLMTGEASAAEAIDRAGKSIEALRGDDGKWDRFPSPGVSRAPTTEPTSQPSTRRAIEIPTEREDFGMTAVLAAVTRTANVGRSVQLARFNERMTFHQQLLASMAGLTESALLDEIPKAHAEAASFSDPLQSRVMDAWRAYRLTTAGN